MKIRFRLTTPSGETSDVEREGQLIRIGRDPECEVPLEGEAALAASRQHAAIELSAGGAVLRDLGSANKTQHNERVVEGPTALRVGDRVQIGFTGSRLVVLCLDLASAVAPRRPALDRRLLFGVAGGVAALLLVACALMFWPRSTGETVADGSPPLPVRTAQNGQTPVLNNPPQRDVENVPPKVAQPAAYTVGHYVPHKDSPPSVLVQRASENQPWTVLRPGQPIWADNTLVSLPGYESLIAVGDVAKVNLWGSLPDFGAAVNECVVSFRQPAKGIDVDLVLERGRVEVGNVKSDGSCKVRLRVLHEEWVVTLAPPDSRICVELIDRLDPDLPDGTRLLSLYARGSVVVQARKKEWALTTGARLSCLTSRPEEQPFFAAKGDLPEWWQKAPSPTHPLVVESRDGLRTWAKQLVGEPDREEEAKPVQKDRPELLTTTIRLRVKESTTNDKERVLGVWFLAALDEPGRLVEVLQGDQIHEVAEVRNTALLGLQDWLRRNHASRKHLQGEVKRRLDVDDTKAELVVRYCLPLREKDRRDPETYQKLIGMLNDGDPVVRHVAFWQLYQGLAVYLPKKAAEIEYDAMQPPQKRAEAVRKWKDLIPRRWVPGRPSP